MKTTAGKTKTVRPKAELMEISAVGHRGVLSVRRASTPAQALEEYFKEALAPKGYKKGKRVGNTLQVSNKAGVKTYSAVRVT